MFPLFTAISDAMTADSGGVIYMSKGDLFAGYGLLHDSDLFFMVV